MDLLGWVAAGMKLGCDTGCSDRESWPVGKQRNRGSGQSSWKMGPFSTSSLSPDPPTCPANLKGLLGESLVIKNKAKPASGHSALFTLPYLVSFCTALTTFSHRRHINTISYYVISGSSRPRGRDLCFYVSHVPRTVLAHSRHSINNCWINDWFRKMAKSQIRLFFKNPTARIAQAVEHETA